MKPEEYVSTACRVGEHEECRRRPVVRCACWCHAADDDEGSREHEQRG